MNHDPWQHVKPINPADLENLADTCGELYQFDDVPTFNTEADPEVDPYIRLADDKHFVRTPTRRFYIDYRSNPDAYRHLDPMPQEGETVHSIISGKFALYELIPAMIERTGQKIDHLHIATLSFSKANAADLLSLLDDGWIKRVDLIISYYFKSTSRPIYDALIPQLRERGHRVLAMRNHCKILLFELEDGTRYVAEGSANLRSAQNCENVAITREAGLWEFHRQWMEDELLHGKELGEEKPQPRGK